jgi:hypothetical protein
MIIVFVMTLLNGGLGIIKAMTTIYLFLSTKVDANPQKEIRLRFKHWTD